MGKYVNEQVAKAARSAGTLIGKTEPSRETKGTWWEVYANEGELIACVMVGPDWVSCGESIRSSDLHLYVDDVEAANAALKTFGVGMTTIERLQALQSRLIDLRDREYIPGAEEYIKGVRAGYAMSAVLLQDVIELIEAGEGEKA